MSSTDLNLHTHHDAYVDLLEQVCSGEDQSMGKFKDGGFWSCFADKLCRNLKIPGLSFKRGMEVECERRCEILIKTFLKLKVILKMIVTHFLFFSFLFFDFLIFLI